MSQMHVEGLELVGAERLHLDSFTAGELQRTCARAMGHVRARLGDTIEVTVHLKERHVLEGERFIATVNVQYSGGVIRGFAEEWYLTAAVKVAFDDVLAQAENTMLGI